MPKLRIKIKDRWQEAPVRPPRFVIGRSVDCDFVIESGYISRQHCELVHEDSGWIIRDLGSSLGTEHNGTVVRESPIQLGDNFKLASRFQAVFMPDADTEPGVGQTETLRVVRPPSVRREGERLVAMNGPQSGRTYSLEGDLVCVGRTEDNEIHLPVDTVSSHHAELVREGQRWVVRDLGSGNGTFVNQKRTDIQTLESGDVIDFDRISFRYEESHFRMDHSGTRVRGELLDEEEPAPKDVTLSRMELTPDIPIPRERKHKKNGGLGLLILIMVLLIAILAGATYLGGRYFLDLWQPEITESGSETVKPL